MNPTTTLSNTRRGIFTFCLAALLLIAPACNLEQENPRSVDDIGNADDTSSTDASSTDTTTTTTTTPTDNAWNWVPIDGSKCGNGSTAGYGLLPRKDTTRLAIYFSGGGACWDYASCYVFNAAINIEANYDEARFRNEVGQVGENDFFGDASYVFFPYCTADLHAGNSIGQYDALNPDRKIHHNGTNNTALYLENIKKQYPNVKTVHVLGVSAGGYGAMFNYEKIRETFSDAEVHVLADSAPFVQPREGRWSMWKSAWKLQLPSDCDTCAEKMPNVANHLITKYTDSRFGLLSWEDDATIMIFFAYGAGELGPAVRSLAKNVYAPDNASTFLVEGTDHVMLVRPPTLKAKNNQTFGEYLLKWAYQ